MWKIILYNRHTKQVVKRIKITTSTPKWEADKLWSNHKDKNLSIRIKEVV